ncbi:hypothetical protein MP638_002732 [Amoeboaphelidium occidentale]|nr:hypothetical protein MP638_002732 [Amoeboaphelidium occidentale]
MGKLAALISGGKDSVFNVLHCIANGHDIACLLNLYPTNNTDEDVDSWMYQTVGSSMVPVIADCMRLPLMRAVLRTDSKSNTSATYNESIGQADKEEEVEDLYILIKNAKEQYHIEGVSVGAILSTYQRVRVENVCKRLGLKVYAYLWQQGQLELMDSLVKCSFDVRLCKVAGMGLKKDLLMQKPVDEDFVALVERLESLYGTHPAGEGGEFESLVFDCPLFYRKIVLTGFSIHVASDDKLAPVAYATKISYELEDKNETERQKALNDAIEFIKREFFTSDPLQDVLQSEVISYSAGITTRSLKTPVITFQSAQFSSILNVCLSGLKYDDQGKSLTIVEECNVLFDYICRFYNCEILNDAVFCQVVLRDMDSFAAVNEAYAKRFPFTHPSCRACIENKYQFEKSDNISISIIVSRQKSDKENSILHVQSISYWAPANIGPYSQSIHHTSSGNILMSGQIGLLPEKMRLAFNLRDQVRLAFKHSESVVSASAGNAKIIHNVCFFTTNVRDRLEEIQNQAKTCTSGSCCFAEVSGLPMGAFVEVLPHAYVSSDAPIFKVTQEDNLTIVKTYCGEKLVAISTQLFLDQTTIENGEFIAICRTEMRKMGKLFDNFEIVNAFINCELELSELLQDSPCQCCISFVPYACNTNVPKDKKFVFLFIGTVSTS